MLFKEFGTPGAPTVILLHGGGLSWWSLEPVIDLLVPEYRVVAPVIDGYGEDAAEIFQSIEASARHLLAYIKSHCGGKVYALGGLSIGAQIAAEVLSLQPDAADYAILESALVIPLRGTTAFTVPMTRMSYGLIKQRWFAKLQARELCVPEEQFERYYADSVRLSKQSLLNTLRSNGTYALQKEIGQTTAKTLIIVGEKEIGAMQKSARLLAETIPGSTLFIAPKMKHGELSLQHPEQYTALLQTLFAQSAASPAQAGGNAP